MDFVDLRGFTSEQSTILLCINLVKPRKLKSNARANLVKPRKLKSNASAKLVKPPKLKRNACANLEKPRKSESGFQSPRVHLVKPRKSRVTWFYQMSVYALPSMLNACA